MYGKRKKEDREEPGDKNRREVVQHKSHRQNSENRAQDRQRVGKLPRCGLIRGRKKSGRRGLSGSFRPQPKKWRGNKKGTVKRKVDWRVLAGGEKGSKQMADIRVSHYET